MYDILNFNIEFISSLLFQIEVLVLAYYLNSERSGYFEKEPFCVGLKELGYGYCLV